MIGGDEPVVHFLHRVECAVASESLNIASEKQVRNSAANRAVVEILMQFRAAGVNGADRLVCESMRETDDRFRDDWRMRGPRVSRYRICEIAR